MIIKNGERITVQRNIVRKRFLHDDTEERYAIDGKFLGRFSILDTVISMYDFCVHEQKIYDFVEHQYLVDENGEPFIYCGMFSRYFFMKSNNKYYIYNIISKKIEEECDFYISKKEEKTILAFQNGKAMRKFDRALTLEDKEMLNKKHIFEVNKVIVVKSEMLCKDRSFELNDIKVANDEILEFFDTIVAVIVPLEQICKFYLLSDNGTKYVGYSSIFTNKVGDETPRMELTKGFLALEYDKNWRIYDKKTGKELFDRSFTNLYQHESEKYWIAVSKNFIAIFNADGEELLTFKGYKSVLLAKEKYFLIKDNNEDIWVFDENGEKVFNECFPYRTLTINVSRGLLFKVQDEYNTSIYNCGTGKVQIIPAIIFKMPSNNSAYYYKSNDNWEYYMFVRKQDCLCGVYQVDENNNFYPLIPIKYESVLKQDDFFICQKGKETHVYNKKGELMNIIDM